MEYPAAKVKNVHEILSKGKDILSNQEVKEEIHKLTEDERCQLFWLLHQNKNLPLNILSKESELWDGIKALFCGDYSNTG